MHEDQSTNPPRPTEYTHLLKLEGSVWEAQARKYQAGVSYLSCWMQFNMPVEVTWNKISDKLLRDFWARHPAEQQGLADISDRILVFHRGIKEVC